MTCACTRAGPWRERHQAAASVEDRQAGQGVAAVHLAHQQVGEGAHQLRDAAAGGLDLDRHRDRVAVVLDEVEDGQLQVGGGVEALPELALGRRAVPGGAVDDLVARERGGRGPGHVARRQVQAGLRAADRLEELGAGGRGLRDHVEPRVAPVRGHLPAAGARVVLRPDRAQHHLVGRHAELEHQGPVAVVGVEPVVAGLEDQARRDEHRLVAGAADLEEDPVLALELDLLVVEPPRQEHGAVHREEGLAVQAQPAVHRRCHQVLLLCLAWPRPRGGRRVRGFANSTAGRGVRPSAGPRGTGVRRRLGPGRSRRQCSPGGRRGRAGVRGGGRARSPRRASPRPPGAAG